MERPLESVAPPVRRCGAVHGQVTGRRYDEPTAHAVLARRPHGRRYRPQRRDRPGSRSRRSSAHARWSACSAWRGSVRPRGARLEEGQLPARRRARLRGDGNLVKDATSSCTWRSSSWAGRARAGRSTSIGSRNVFEGRRLRSRQAPGLRVLRSRLRLPSREPPAAHRGGLRARQLSPLLLRSESGGRGAVARDPRSAAPPRPTSSVPASSAARRAQLLLDSLPYTQVSSGCRVGAATARHRAAPRPYCPIQASPPARAPRRRGQRDTCCCARPRTPGA